jgi:hypothetical protein
MGTGVDDAAGSSFRELGKLVAESSAFAGATLAVTVLLLVREYFNNLFEIAENYPRVIGLAYLLGGWFFAILMALLALIVSPSDGVTVTRMSLLFASASLAFGPFYVFAPTRPIKLRKQSVLKALATVARKKESRWATFAVFVALTALQGIVAYDLYALLTSISVPFEQVALTVFGYVLLTLFYLVVFYTTMLGRVFRFNDLDVVEHIRKHAFVEFKKRLHVLSSRSYAPWYVALFVVAVVLQLVVVGLAVSNAVADGYFGGLSLAQQVLFGVFAVALLLLLLVSISFVLVSAFRPVPVKVATATDKEIERALEQFSSEEREVIALHWTKSQYADDDLFKVYAARIPTAIRQLIDDTALELIHMNVRESKTKLIEAVGVAHLRLLSGSARAVLTTSEDVAEDSVDQWLALFTDRDGKAEDDGTDKAARRRVLFYSLAHAFSTPARWAELFSAVADDDAAAKVAADDDDNGSDEDKGDELRDLSRKTALAPADEQESKASALDDIEKSAADADDARNARQRKSKEKASLAPDADAIEKSAPDADEAQNARQRQAPQKESKKKASPAPASPLRKEMAHNNAATNSIAPIANLSSPSSAANVFASASSAPPGGGAGFGAAPPPHASSVSPSPPPPPQSSARDDARLAAVRERSQALQSTEASDLIVNTSTASLSKLSSVSVPSTQTMGGGPPRASAASPSPPPPSAAPAPRASSVSPSPPPPQPHSSARDDARLAAASHRKRSSPRKRAISSSTRAQRRCRSSLRCRCRPRRRWVVVRRRRPLRRHSRSCRHRVWPSHVRYVT